MRWRMNHKQRRQEVGLGPAGIAGPVVLNVSVNCKSFCFGSIGPFANNVVGLAITHCVIGVSPRKNSVHQWSWDRRNRSE